MFRYLFTLVLVAGASFLSSPSSSQTLYLKCDAMLLGERSASNEVGKGTVWCSERDP